MKTAIKSCQTCTNYSGEGRVGNNERIRGCMLKWWVLTPEATRLDRGNKNKIYYCAEWEAPRKS